MSLYKRKTSPNWQYKLYPWRRTAGTGKHWHPRQSAGPGIPRPAEGRPVEPGAARHEAAPFVERRGRALRRRTRGPRQPGNVEDSPALARPAPVRRRARRYRPQPRRRDRAREAPEPRTVRTRHGIVETDRAVSDGTVRRVIGVLKSVLNAAVEWEWLERAPVTKRAKIVSKRIRWLTPAEAERLLAELPAHLADMARFSLETGLRRANVTGLRWSQVDLARRVAWIHRTRRRHARPSRCRFRKPRSRYCAASTRTRGRRSARTACSPIAAGRSTRRRRPPGPGAAACRPERFPLARPASYVGELARAARHAAAGAQGAGRMGDDGNGAAVRAPVGRSPRAMGHAADGRPVPVPAAIQLQRDNATNGENR